MQEGSDMEQRGLGNSGIVVSPAGMGCMGFTRVSGAPLVDDDAARVVREAYEVGYAFFDAAECYVGEREDGTTAAARIVRQMLCRPGGG